MKGYSYYIDELGNHLTIDEEVAIIENMIKGDN